MSRDDAGGRARGPDAPHAARRPVQCPRGRKREADVRASVCGCVGVRVGVSWVHGRVRPEGYRKRRARKTMREQALREASMHDEGR